MNQTDEPSREKLRASKAVSRFMRSWWRDKTPEERAAHTAKAREAASARRASLTPEERAREASKRGSAPRPGARKSRRCPCGKYTLWTAAKLYHSCQAEA